MEFKYSLSLLFSNMGYVIRIFLWVLFAMLVTACIGAAILVPVFDAFAEAPEVAEAASAFMSEINEFLDDGMSIRTFIESMPPSRGRADSSRGSSSRGYSFMRSIPSSSRSATIPRPMSSSN